MGFDANKAKLAALLAAQKGGKNMPQAAGRGAAPAAANPQAARAMAAARAAQAAKGGAPAGRGTMPQAAGRGGQQQIDPRKLAMLKQAMAAKQQQGR